MVMPMRDLIKNRFRRDIERERILEPRFEKFSRLLWPWSESKLVLFITTMAILDSVSTFAALKLSVQHVTEVGLIASRVLKVGGYPYLFLEQLIIIAALLLLAQGARLLYTRWGFPGFGRTAFIFLLIPYTTVISAFVINNIFVTFMGQYK
jgi:hypothetical protein